ncbi:MAG: sigma-70 family RNA polymerase sigma factor, partial [Pseudomonadota bacterium]
MAQDQAAQLLHAMGAGDVRAARRLSDMLTPRIYAQAYRMTGHSAQAEDIVQEVLVKLWKQAPTWDDSRAKVSTWVYRVTANACLDHLRRPRLLGDDAIPDMADMGPSASQHLQHTARVDALQEALMQLPDRQRQAVVLRYIEGLSNPDIAHILDTSVDAIESLSARGKRALSNILRPQ